MRSRWRKTAAAVAIAGALALVPVWGTPVMAQEGVGGAGGYVEGTRGDDSGFNSAGTLAGSDGPDVIRALAGDDLVYAYGGGDAIFGGPGDDSVFADYPPQGSFPGAPTGPDAVFGGRGDDSIDTSTDGGAADAVYCGPGDDRVTANPRDFVADDCEIVDRFGAG